MRRRVALLFAFLSLAGPNSILAGDDAVAMESVRSRFVQAGELDIKYFNNTHDPGFRNHGVLMRGLMKEPTDLLVRCVHAALEQGTIAEKLSALEMHEILLGSRRIPKDPAYGKVLFDLVSRDDGKVPPYTFELALDLMRYPSKEAVAAIMGAADRAEVPKYRDSLILYAAQIVEMESVVAPQPGWPPTEDGVAKFRDWFEKHKDEIQFTKEGRVKLGKGRPAEERAELTEQNRAAIRKDAVCVLNLTQFVLGDPSAGAEANAKTRELNARCGPALFGTERSAVMEQMADAGEGGAGRSSELELKLHEAADYPMQDAALLAAVYAVSYERDPEALRFAGDILSRTPRDEIRRVCKGEPSSVRKKAESLAGRKP